MCKRKRFRKILNIFLCVLSIAVVFSFSAMAADVFNGSGFRFYDSDLNIDVEYTYLDNGDEILNYYFYISSDQCIVGKSLVSGGTLPVHTFDLPKFDYVWDAITGEIFYLNDGDYLQIKTSDADGRYYDLRLCREGYLSGLPDFMTIVVRVITDFSKIITENALLLLFAIGLPVCSLGVGFLIRLKERT